MLLIMFHIFRLYYLNCLSWMSDGTREVLPDSSASVLNVCCGFVGNILFHKEGCYTERRSRREFAEQELENPNLALLLASPRVGVHICE
jgi:hypothetical protein